MITFEKTYSQGFDDKNHKEFKTVQDNWNLKHISIHVVWHSLGLQWYVIS